MGGKADPLHERIWAAVRRIPEGKVATYGQVAQMAGLPRRARLAGTALKRLPKNSGVPWHRVIRADGSIAFPEGSPGRGRQSARLRREGVPVRGGRVDLKRYRWRSEDWLDELLWGPERRR